MKAVLAALALVGSPLSAQDIPEPTTLAPVNPSCPVLEGEPNDPEMTLLYQGVAVGLCCEDCQRKFTNSPERYARGTPELVAAFAALPQPASQNPGNAAPAPSNPPASPPQPSSTAEAGGFLDFAGRFHPLTVHFPIALLIAAALGEILVLLGWSAAGSGAAFAHRLGTLGALVAAPLGIALEQTTKLAPSLHDTIEWHERLGLAAAGGALLSLALAEWSRHGGPAWSRTAYRLILFAAVAAVSLAGHFGAKLIWGADYLPF